jgi:hypothetical protein
MYDLTMFWKKLSLLEAIYEVSYALNTVKPTTISKLLKEKYFQIKKLMTAWDWKKKAFQQPS